jgi:hypothetical protein
VRKVLKEVDGVLYDSGLDAVKTAIMAYVRELHLSGKPNYSWTYAQAKQAAEQWLGSATPIKPEEVAWVRWQGETGLTYSRLPWEMRAQTELPPTWAALVGRMAKNPDCFVQYIGSLFFRDSYSQQYLWIRGPGGDGKGAISRWLYKVLGRSYWASNAPKSTDRFWLSDLREKRLWVIPDYQMCGFETDPAFMQLTGGDPMASEAKNQVARLDVPEVRLIIMSQHRPQISQQRAHRRRIVYVEFAEGMELDMPSDQYERWEAALWAEGGHFLAYCMQQYREKCGNGPIACDVSQDLDDWASAEDAMWTDLLEAGGFKIDMTELHGHERQRWVKPTQVLDWAMRSLRGRSDLQALYGWLAKKGVAKQNLKFTSYAPGGRPMQRQIKVYKYLTNIAREESDS